MADTLSTADLRKVLRVVSRICAVPSAPEIRRRYLLEGLCQLIGATAAVSILIACCPASSQANTEVLFESPIFVGIEGGKRRALLRRWLARPWPSDPAEVPLARLLRKRWQLTTRSRSQLVTAQAWYSSEHVRSIRKAVGVDHCIYSVLPFDEQLPQTRADVPTDAPIAGVLCFSRPWGDKRPFTSRQVQIVHLIHSEACWIYHDCAEAAETDRRDTSRASSQARLTPRQRQSLDGLLAGQSEKQVAARLGLSPHTVHVHIKGIYKHFQVSSRAELLARFLK